MKTILEILCYVCAIDIVASAAFAFYIFKKKPFFFSVNKKTIKILFGVYIAITAIVFAAYNFVK